MKLVNRNTGVTKQNGYVNYDVTAAFIFQRGLAHPCRWVQQEELFGIHSSARSEVFYECARSLYETRGHLVNS